MTEKAATDKLIAFWDREHAWGGTIAGTVFMGMKARIKEQQATIERHRKLILELCPEGAVKPAVQFLGG